MDRPVCREGSAVEGLEDGYYIQPTVFEGVNSMRVFQEEIFGPVVSVTKFRDMTEALDIANDTLFMILVQVLLPRLLALLAVMALVDPLRNLHPATATLWPHRWSLAAQVLLMLISAELLRY